MNPGETVCRHGNNALTCKWCNDPTYLGEWRSDAEVDAEVAAHRESHHPPEHRITPAIEQFIDDHGMVVGFEAWQTFHEMIGQPEAMRTFKLFRQQRHWNEAAKACLRDFAVWYDAGHFRER